MSKSISESDLQQRLRIVWNRIQRKNLGTGFLTLFRWAIPLFLVGMLIDWLTYMPAAGRAVILLIILGVSFYKAWQHSWRKLQSFSAKRMALEVEHQDGGLESILVTAVQFGESTKGNKASSELIEATCAKAELTIGNIEPTKVVSYRSLKKPLIIASALVTCILIFGLAKGPFLSAGLTRIFTPWSNVAYPTNTILKLENKGMVVKEGEKAEISMALSGVVPKTVEFYLRTGDGDPREIELPVEDGNCAFTLASASRDFSYRVKAGDARSDWHQVKVIPAPRIETVEVTQEFPSYLERENETVEALTLTVPQQTKLHWKLSLDRPVTDAKLHRDGVDPLPLTVTNGGRQIIIEEEVNASRGYSFSWTENEHGFDFTSPRFFLQVATDKAPRLELTSPESNLIAMVGRPVDLYVRVKDDYGIGKSSIAYRVNQREEQNVDIDLASKNGKGEQLIDWDYRKSLSDLKIGDTVSFTIETSDRYPGAEGPHEVRSDTKRITFLSEKEYLRQIQKKKNRLLTRMLSVYRQQRSAFDTVNQLNPASETYIQTCQVEAIRQELVRDQLKQISIQFKLLLDDLAANNASEAPQAQSLELIRSSLNTIADEHLATAAQLLRHQSSLTDADTQEKPDPIIAASAVNTAARELGSLVLLRSIEMAQEVYARETQMLAQQQASIRWRALQTDASEAKKALSEQQAQLAQWTEKLTSDLKKGMRYEKRPLAVLRLIQSIKALEKSQTKEKMLQAAAMIKDGKPAEARPLQTTLITNLLDAQYSVRANAAYSTLLKTVSQIRLIVKVQSMLREQCSKMSADDFNKRNAELIASQTDMRQRLLEILLPTVPAPRTRLEDDHFPEAPPIQSVLKTADEAILGAIKQITEGNKEAAITFQLKAEQTLSSLEQSVAIWSEEMAIQTLGLSEVVVAANERLAILAGFEAEVLSILERTDLAAADDQQKVDTIAVPHGQITKAIELFSNDLIQDHQTNPNQDNPPLISRMKRLEQYMRDALIALKSNKSDEAITLQEQAADTLAEAFALVTNQSSQLELLQSLYVYQRSITHANSYMSDIVAEQSDLMEATEALKTDKFATLFPTFSHLKQSMDQVSPLLQIVSTRVDAGRPLEFAMADMEDALNALKNDDQIDSLDAQDVASESLKEVNALVKNLKSQTGYVAEIIEYLHILAAYTANLEYKQQELSLKVQSAKEDNLKSLTEEQAKLAQEALKIGKIQEAVIGIVEKAESDEPTVDNPLAAKKPEPVGIVRYTEPAKFMKAASDALSSRDKGAAVEQIELTLAELQKNAQSLYTVIEVLHGLPNVDVELKKITDPGIMRLVHTLDLADAHKVLFRNMAKIKKEDLSSWSAKQKDIVKRCAKLAITDEPHAMLQNASSSLAAAEAAMQSADLIALKNNQEKAMIALQHFIIEQAVLINTAIPPAASSEAPAAISEGGDERPEFEADSIADFVDGEAPKNKKADGWDVRADRNRAALNQNFARELPLEYRSLLKDYYEKVAK